MEKDEDLVDCISCGTTMSSSRDRAFALNDDAFLCFECATQRGGTYDESEDRWVVAPGVADLEDERRPA